MTPRELAAILRRPLGQLPAELELCPVAAPFDVTIRPPGSKSLTNRALLLAALGEGESTLTDCLLDADDARVMIDALRTLGTVIEVTDTPGAGNRLHVRGVNGRLRGGCMLMLNNAGTATRFLTAAACLADTPVVIDGNERMRRRPIGELLELLRRLGVRADELGAPGCVPVRVHPCRPEGGVLDIGATQSSQFISALMMIAPWMRHGLDIRFTTEPTSRSYIEMTLGLISRLYPGYIGKAPATIDGSVRLPPGPVHAASEYRVEPDASGAVSFWAAAATIPGSRCAVTGLDHVSLQADASFVNVLCMIAGEPCGESGTSRGPARLRGGADVDLGLMPDTAMAAACVAALAESPTTLRGLRTLRVKETDRADALHRELGKLGVRVEVEAYESRTCVRDELLRITPPPGGIDRSPTAARIDFDTYDDHRMAMSLAIIGLRRPNVVIRDPACVAKTYPGFWRDWAALYHNITDTPHPGRPA